MAITVLQQPSNGCALSHPNWIYLNSNLANTWADFRYIIVLDWYDYDSATPNQPINIGKFRIVPDPNTKKGAFDISRIIINYFNHIFKGSYDVISYQTDQVNVKFSYSFGEFYNGTEHFSIQSVIPKKAYYYYDDILSSQLTTAYPTEYNWLTDRDLTRMKVPKARNFYLPLNNIYNGSVTSQTLEYFNYINGGVNDDGQISFNLEKKCIELNLNSLSLNDLVYGYDIPEIDRYDISLTKPLGEQSSVASINYVCVKNNDLQLHFLNRFGAFETASFYMANREASEIERKTFKQRGYTNYNSAVLDYQGYPSGGLGFITYVKDFKETIFYQNKKTEYTLVSDYVNEKDYKWLQQLINSPKVYVEKYNGNTTINYPCLIKTAEWREKLQGADKIFNLEITIQVGEQII